MSATPLATAESAKLLQLLRYEVPELGTPAVVCDTLTVNTSPGLALNNQTNKAAAGIGALSNCPTAGNPAKWVSITIDGVGYAVPCWLA